MKEHSHFWYLIVMFILWVNTCDHGRRISEIENQIEKNQSVEALK